MPANTHARVLALVALAILTAAVAVVLGVLAIGERDDRRQEVSIAMAVQDDVFPALVYIAEEQGYFDEEGVRVALRSFPSSRMALRAVRTGETQMGTSTGVPIVWEALHGNEVEILCTLGFTDHAFRVVGRRDRGIERPTDLAGKTVATPEGSAEQLFLDVFLEHHGLEESDVRLVFMPAVDLPDALVEGRIDAFALRQPFIGEAMTGLGNEAVVFRGPDHYRSYFALINLPGAFQPLSETPDGVLRALVRAERLVRTNPELAREAVVRQLGETRRAEVEQLWPEYRFEVSASQSFLITLESEARWLIRRYPDHEEPMPNFLEMFHTQPLLRVRPESVTVWK